MSDYRDLVVVKNNSPIEFGQNVGAGEGLHVVVKSDVSVADSAKLQELSSEYSSVSVCIGHNSNVTNLEFIEKIENINSFSLYDFDFTAFDDLNKLPTDLKSLLLAATNSKKLSLSILNNFPKLERVFLEGHKKDIQKVKENKNLKSITLRSITLDSLQPILSVNADIEMLDIKLGGTNNLADLPSFESLKYLELWKIRGLVDLSPISHLLSVQNIFLQSLKNVETIPDLTKLTSLRRIVFDSMKGINDLTMLKFAPALEELGLVSMSNLVPESFEPLINHPTLKVLRAGLGSQIKNKRVSDLIKLPNEFQPFQYS